METVYTLVCVCVRAFRVCVCVCVCVRDQKDAQTEGDRGFTAEIKMESILVLEAHSSTV